MARAPRRASHFHAAVECGGAARAATSSMHAAPDTRHGVAQRTCKRHRSWGTMCQTGEWASSRPRVVVVLLLCRRRRRHRDRTGSLMLH